MSTGAVMPTPYQQFFDNNGKPLAGGYLYAYAAGTSTPQATYFDVGLTTPHTNPIVLDSAGRALVFLDALSYKFVLQDASHAPIWTVDGIASTALASNNLGGTLFVFGGEEETPVVVTSYPSGATYDKCHPDTAWVSVDSANLVGTYQLQAMLKVTGGNTVTLALVNLSDGNPNTPIVTISSTSATGERQISSGVTFAAAGSVKTYAVKSLVTAGVGYAFGIQLIRTA